MSRHRIRTSNVEDTTYVNDAATGAMEEHVVLSGTTTWRDYVLADGHIVMEKFSGGCDELHGPYLKAFGRPYAWSKGAPFEFMDPSKGSLKLGSEQARIIPSTSLTSPNFAKSENFEAQRIAGFLEI